MAIYVDPTFQAGRVSIRPLEFKDTNSGQLLGHYQAVTFSGAAASIGAGTAGILASLWWADATRYFVLTRLAIDIEVITAVTAAPLFDVQAFIFRGATGASAGTGSSTLSLTGNNQKVRKNMGASLLSNGGELRTFGTTTALTAATGKTNDAAPFGAAFLPMLNAVTATGTAVLLPVGAGTTCGWNDVYKLDNAYKHPIYLSEDEGIEIQTITANNTTGTVKYGFLWEWAEVST